MKRSRFVTYCARFHRCDFNGKNCSIFLFIQCKENVKFMAFILTLRTRTKRFRRFTLHHHALYEKLVKCFRYPNRTISYEKCIKSDAQHSTMHIFWNRFLHLGLSSVAQHVNNSCWDFIFKSLGSSLEFLV